MTISSIAETAVHAAAEAAKPEQLPQMPPPESVSRFEDLMQQPLVAPGGDAGQHAGNHLVEAIRKQDGQMEAALEQVESLSAHSASLSPTQQIAAAAQVSLNLSLAQFDFQTKMAVVSASKSSAETLMKNQ
ncbi:Type III secretion protein [Paraburkholderia sabiae]|jgi:type III secretion inner rod protein HrpB2|uniref:type III secretion protein n=1 Tax=Paraburkholderia sabiae TaxID=273251 RepID=UPI001CB0E15D|nr:type III secretion protein [Paraburkholderia sabiae]CAG9233682.1 Type III secretion protein [Paraburkholderia sabiae]